MCSHIEYERFIGKKHRTAAKKEDEDKDYGKSLMRPPPTPALPVPKPQMANQVQYIKSEPEQKSLMAIGKKNDDNELAHEQEQELELERQLERQLEWQHEQERRETAPSPTATMDEVYKAVANARRAAAAAREPARAFSATEPEWDTDDF